MSVEENRDRGVVTWPRLILAILLWCAITAFWTVYLSSQTSTIMRAEAVGLLRIAEMDAGSLARDLAITKRLDALELQMTATQAQQSATQDTIDKLRLQLAEHLERTRKRELKRPD